MSAESWIDECLASVAEQCERESRKDAVRLANDRVYEAQISYLRDELWKLFEDAVACYNGRATQSLQHQTLPHGEFSVRRVDSPSCHLLIALDRAARLMTCSYSYTAFRGKVEKGSKQLFIGADDNYLLLRQENGASIAKEDAVREIFSPFFKRAPRCP